MSDHDGDEFYTRVTIDPMLTYVAHSINNSPIESVQRACRGFYTLEEVNKSKEILWNVGDENVLPPFKRRRDSPKMSEIDKTIEDIVSGVHKLDSSSKLPVFAVDPVGLGRIPKAMPAEMHPISVCERINRLEAQITQLADLEARMEQAERRIEKVPTSYAAAVASTVASTSTSPTSNCTPPGPPPPAVPHVRCHEGAPPGPPPAAGLYVRMPPPRTAPKSSSAASVRPQMTTVGKGASMLHTAAAVSAVFGSQTSLVSSVPSHYSEGFEYPADQRRRQRKKTSGTRKAVTGTSLVSSGKLRGAPEPSRDIFVYRAVKGTLERDIEEYLCEHKIAVRKVTLSSNEEAKFASFKVEIKASDMRTVFDADFWPIGICARRFFKPKVSNTPDNP